MGVMLVMAGCSSGVSGGVDIWQAIEQDDSAAIAIYAASGGDVDVLNGDGSTPLWVAFDKEHRESYEALLEYGADPNIVMSGKRVVTHWAAMREDSWWLSLALAHGADPDLVNVGWGRPSEGTPLHFTLGNGVIRDTAGALRNVELLVSSGADVNKTDRYGCDPLAIAGAQNKFRIALYLLNHGADFRRSKRKGVTFLENIRIKCENRDRWFLLKEDREGLDAVREWLEARGVEIERE